MPRRRLKPLTCTDDLESDPHNANRGTTRGRTLLKESLESYGAGRSILTDRHGRVIAGNKTMEVARDLGLPIQTVDSDGRQLIVVRRTDLELSSDPRAKHLALADNRVGELDLDWDPEMLQHLKKEGVDVLLFWTAEEFEQLLGEGTHPGAAHEDEVVAPPETDISRGDLFQLGQHRLLCGDATSREDVARLLDGETPLLLVTDPPYGVNYDPEWRHRVNPDQRTAVGKVLNDQRSDWHDAFVVCPTDIAYVWHAGLHADVVAASLAIAGFELRSQIVWRKQHFAMSRGLYHWQHEPAWFAVRRGRPAHWRGDRTQSTVWDVPNLNPMGGQREGENSVTGHGTQKPVRLFEIPILNHTSTTDAVMDPFVGSGTAMIAAQKTGRRAFCMDVDPRYVQTTIDRWERFAGQRAQRVPARRSRKGGRR